eukprot:scaffold13603_cov112-Isochrysis_galbana.AAC.15
MKVRTICSANAVSPVSQQIQARLRAASIVKFCASSATVRPQLSAGALSEPRSPSSSAWT